MTKGLLRDIKLQKGWLIAIIILIALSAGIYSSFRSIYDSTIRSVDKANVNLNSPDIIITTIPGRDLSSEIKNLEGISMVSPIFSFDTYTITNNARVRGNVEAITLLDRVGNYQIIKGNDLVEKNDIIVEHHYASKHNVFPGDKITLYIDGVAKEFNIQGIYFSPNNLYMISPEGWVENDFGYFQIPINESVNPINRYKITLDDKLNVESSVGKLKTFFSSNSINAVIMPTKKMLSTTAFKEDAKAMNSLANMFTILLLFISSFIFFIVLSRNVDRKQREIGIYRAMGFSKLSVFKYFISFSGIAVIAGIILSIPIAQGLLVYIINFWGKEILQVPDNFLMYNLNITYVGYSAIFTIFALLFGASFPSWRAASIKPAEAMKSYRTSKHGSRIFSKSVISVTKKLNLRDLFGHRLKSISTIITIALVLSMGISFALSMNSYVKGINDRFSLNELWDTRVNFTDIQDISILNKLKRINGVKSAEPYVGYGAEISKNNHSIIIQFNELKKNTSMTNFSLSSGSVNNDGIIVSGDVSFRLDLSVGDTVSLTTPYGQRNTIIAGIFNEFGSSEVYQLTDIDKPNGAFLEIIPDQSENVKKSLENLSYIKSWVKKEEFKNGWLSMFEEMQGMTYVMDFITVILALLIVGIFAFISTTERRWEFVILKLIGFSNGRIIYGMLIENLVLAIIGSLLGVPIGMRLASEFGDTFQELMSPPPTILTVGPVVIRSLMIIAVTLLTVYVIARLDLRRNVVDKIRRLFGTT